MESRLDVRGLVYLSKKFQKLVPMIQFLGCSKTASKTYKFFLNENTHIHISKELHLFTLKLNKGFFGCFLRYKFSHQSKIQFVKDLSRLKNATFWRYGDFNAEKYYELISEYEKISFGQAVTELLRMDMLENNKTESGAKFSVHILFLPVLMRALSSCKFVLLGRTPKDIYQSQINKHNTSGLLKRLTMIAHVSIMFNTTVLYHFIFGKKENFLFIKYEDFRDDNELIINRLCRFLDLEYSSSVPKLPVLGSQVRGKKKIKKVTSLDLFILNLCTLLPQILYRSID